MYVILIALTSQVPVPKDAEFNTNRMGLPEEGSDETLHALRRQGQLKQELGGKMKSMI